MRLGNRRGPPPLAISASRPYIYVRPSLKLTPHYSPTPERGSERFSLLPSSGSERELWIGRMESVDLRTPLGFRRIADLVGQPSGDRRTRMGGSQFLLLQTTYMSRLFARFSPGLRREMRVGNGLRTEPLVLHGHGSMMARSGSMRRDLFCGVTRPRLLKLRGKLVARSELGARLVDLSGVDPPFHSKGLWGFRLSVWGSGLL